MIPEYPMRQPKPPNMVHPSEGVVLHSIRLLLILRAIKVVPHASDPFVDGLELSSIGVDALQHNIKLRAGIFWALRRDEDSLALKDMMAKFSIIVSM